MILFVSILLLLFIVTYVYCISYKPWWSLFLIPILFVELFVGTTVLPDFTGYPVEVKFVQSEQYTVFKVTNDKDWIYFFVRGDKDSEPRLIQIINTPENKKNADAIEQQAQSGAAIVKFGKKGTQQGLGDDNDQSPQLMTLPDTKILSKDTTE